MLDTHLTRGPSDDLPHFVQHAIELARSLRSVIFADEVVYRDANKEEILQLLRDHITENIVKVSLVPQKVDR